MNTNYREKLRLKSRMIRDEIENFTKSYKTKEDILEFYETLTCLLEGDSFLLLDKKLTEKVFYICTILSFKYPKDDEIKETRTEVFKRIIYLEKIDENKRQEKVRRMIQEERKARNIPDTIQIESKELLEMYARDYENYMIMIHRDYQIGRLNVFYYLATVNKIYRDYPIYAMKNHMFFSFLMIKHEKGLKKDKSLEMYFKATEDFIEELEKEKVASIKKTKKLEET